MTDPVKKILEDAQKVAAETIEGVGSDTIEASNRLRENIGKLIIKEMTENTVNVPDIIHTSIETAILVGMATAPSREIGSEYLADLLSEIRDHVLISSKDPAAGYWCAMS